QPRSTGAELDAPNPLQAPFVGAIQHSAYEQPGHRADTCNAYKYKRGELPIDEAYRSDQEDQRGQEPINDADHGSDVRPGNFAADLPFLVSDECTAEGTSNGANESSVPDEIAQ